MDTDAAPAGPTLPRSRPFDPAREAMPSAPVPATATDQDHRVGVFGHLVTDDSDIAGLVAYSIYKQHKLDWLRSFETIKGRPPEAAELAAYIIGEGTPRRLATYRHLAEATLAGNGPNVDGDGAAGTRHVAPGRRLVGRGGYAGSVAALYGLIAVLFIFGFWLALHYTASTR